MSHPTDVSALYPSSPLGETEGDVPTGRDVEWEPLVDYRRNDVSETTIHGAVAWYSGGNIIHSFGGNVLCYGRSMMKPLMLKVFADELNNLKKIESLEKDLINNLDEHSYSELIKLKSQLNRE